MTKYYTPRLAITVEQDGETVEYTVQTDNRDAVRYDMLRGRKNFPAPDEGAITWMTVLGWSALNREGKMGPDVEKAIGEQIICVVTVDENGEPITEPDGARPTMTDR